MFIVQRMSEIRNIESVTQFTYVFTIYTLSINKIDPCLIFVAGNLLNHTTHLSNKHNLISVCI